MITLLADHNVEFQVHLIWATFSVADWQGFGVRGVRQIEECGLSSDSSDRIVWQHCQSHGLVLITANRNQAGEDSLETTVAELNHALALPVLTIGVPDSVKEPRYRVECAYRVADIAIRLDELRGTGRLFIP